MNARLQGEIHIETLPRIETLVMEFSPALLKKAGAAPAAILGIFTARFPRIHRIEPAAWLKVGRWMV